MPTKGRGGKRQGAPGVQYPNRSDMRQAPRARPGQPYGVAGQQLEAQQQIPLATQAQPAPAPAPAPVMPGGLGPLNAPTTRPNEPITAGLTGGPGPGPEALGGFVAPEDPTISLLKGLLASYPSPDLQALLNQALNNSPTR